MTKSNMQLPQLRQGKFLTDGGFETVLIFHDQMELPEFAAFVLLSDAAGKARIRAYYDDYISIAQDNGCGFILESPTWRASTDWGKLLGYDDHALDAINRTAIELLNSVKAEHPDTSMVVSGCIGPRGDGYVAGDLMSCEDAKAYHSPQINAFQSAGAEMTTALTMTYSQEAIGIAQAAQDAGLPVVISFTVETDGLLPSGQSLKDAIIEVDTATDEGPAYYMINCAHPEHFESIIKDHDAWTSRIRGLRCNASKCSHAELDQAEELDDGDPIEFGQDVARILKHQPQISILGGCCGTDHRHVRALAKSS